MHFIFAQLTSFSSFKQRNTSKRSYIATPCIRRFFSYPSTTSICLNTLLRFLFSSTGCFFVVFFCSNSFIVHCYNLQRPLSAACDVLSNQKKFLRVSLLIAVFVRTAQFSLHWGFRLLQCAIFCSSVALSLLDEQFPISARVFSSISPLSLTDVEISKVCRVLTALWHNEFNFFFFFLKRVFKSQLFNVTSVLFRSPRYYGVLIPQRRNK